MAAVHRGEQVVVLSPVLAHLGDIGLECCKPCLGRVVQEVAAFLRAPEDLAFMRPHVVENREKRLSGLLRVRQWPFAGSSGGIWASASRCQCIARLVAPCGGPARWLPAGAGTARPGDVPGALGLLQVIVFLAIVDAVVAGVSQVSGKHLPTGRHARHRPHVLGTRRSRTNAADDGGAGGSANRSACPSVPIHAPALCQPVKVRVCSE